MPKHLYGLAAILVAACLLFATCRIIDPTPSPSPSPTATPTETPTATPTPEPTATPTPEPRFSVTYNDNQANGGICPVDQVTYTAGSTVTVLAPGITLHKDGYTFGGWNTAADGTGTTYQSRDQLTMPAADLVLYALWQLVAGGGGIVVTTPQPVSITLPAIPAQAHGIELEVTAAVSPSVQDGVWSWYIDGIAQTGQSATFRGGASLGYGRHTIMVTLTRNGVGYSASRSFIVQ